MRNEPNHLRDSINGLAILGKYSEVTFWLLVGYTPIFEQPTGAVNLSQVDLPVVGWKEMRPEDVKRLSTTLNHLHKIINKLLPELRSIDMADAAAAVPISPTEKATRLLAALEALKQTPVVAPSAKTRMN